jgi:hypothetical protein
LLPSGDVSTSGQLHFGITLINHFRSSAVFAVSFSFCGSLAASDLVHERPLFTLEESSSENRRG